MNQYRPPTTFERNRIDILHNKGFFNWKSTSLKR